jgi:hypothetical protein
VTPASASSTLTFAARLTPELYDHMHFAAVLLSDDEAVRETPLAIEGHLCDAVTKLQKLNKACRRALNSLP